VHLDTQLAPGWRTQSAVPAARGNPGAPAQWHRILTLLADVSLFISARSIWVSAASHHLVLTALLSACYASILITGVLALTVRQASTLARLDLVVLVTAVAFALCAWAMDHSGSDEGVLTTQAAREIAAGHPVYGQPWPWLFHSKNVALTPTTSGGYDYTYGYPPLAPLLTVPLLWLGHGGAPATVVGTGALLVGAVVMWRMLPTPWRPAATLACLGFSFLPSYARLGYPAIVGLALLVPVVMYWPRIGRGGRLGSSGVIRAVCLGAACVAQQLPWFVAPFLLAGIYAVRRGELGGRAAGLLVLRIIGIAVTTWLLLNAYFFVQQPQGWLEGVVLPLTQGAVLHGQGLDDVSLYFTDGSGRLDWYSHASMLLAAGLLVLFVLFVRRLGPAATVLPWCAFYLATRSQDGYYLLMTPLWLAGAITAPAAEFEQAWQPRPGPLTGPRARPALAALAALVVLPALLSAVLAVTGTPPLRMSVTSERRISANVVSALTLKVTNTVGNALTPHFMVTTGQGMSRYWSLTHGPATLPAHSTTTLVIRPPSGRYDLPKPSAMVRLRAFTDTPQTLSSQDVHLRQVPGGSGGRTTRAKERRPVHTRAGADVASRRPAGR